MHPLVSSTIYNWLVTNQPQYGLNVTKKQNSEFQFLTSKWPLFFFHSLFSPDRTWAWIDARENEKSHRENNPFLLQISVAGNYITPLSIDKGKDVEKTGEFDSHSNRHPSVASIGIKRIRRLRKGVILQRRFFQNKYQGASPTASARWICLLKSVQWTRSWPSSLLTVFTFLLRAQESSRFER